MANVASSPAAQNELKSVSSKKLLKVVEKPKTEKIRVELNIERWPAIWQPSKSKNKAQLRIFERETKLADGSKVVSRVEVSFNHLGTLTTEEQKMFYALIKHWEDSGRLDTQVFFSDRMLARILGKGWGTNVIESTTKSLRKLRSISLEWINSYYDKTNEGTVLRQRRPFTILGELRIVERAEQGSVNKALGYFRFDDHILRNLLGKYTKPFLIEEFFKIKTDIGLLLYNHVDLIMANKQKYERCTMELFDDLGLKNPEYNFMHKRKRALEAPIKELMGLRLSTGVLTSAAIEKTNDKKDYKVVFYKSAEASGPAGELESAPDDRSIERGEHVVINHYGRPQDPVRQDAHQLVQHFYQLFHGGVNADLPDKAINQAVTLIANHGLGKAKYIVDFSFHAAKETKFEIQHFGGILNYASKALADFEAHKHQQQKSRQFMERQSQELKQEDEARDKAEARLAALTPEQYKARFEAAKAELFQQYPFMTRQKDGNKIHEGAIRARMIRTITDEPMDLLVIDLPPESGN